ncbi:MAG TPA: hypothetical protein VIL72_02080 [Beijerinckiaceae bacterium]|jgi:hypothetical protein
MTLELTNDRRLSEWAFVFEEVAKGSAKRGFSDALNKASDKSRTQVRRALVRQSGMPYRSVAAGMHTVRSRPETLEYRIEQDGNEQNVNLFRARYTRRGVSAAPWGARQVFEGTFIVPRYGRKVFRRMTDDRFPLRQVWGPNIAREILRDEPPRRWQEVLGDLEWQVQNQFRRLLAGGFR